MCAYRRRTWDEKELARILAAHRGGLSTAEIATRFACTATTIQKRLSELRAREELGMAR
jgi:DNA-directed RNA polymerase specialized sigma24 family protein